MNPHSPVFDAILPARDRAALAGLELTATGPSRRMTAGIHRAGRVGRDTDFYDYRGYAPGEDAAAIDWKVLARSDRLYIRRARTPASMPLCVVIDSSMSMGFRGIGHRWQHEPGVDLHSHDDSAAASKLQVACQLAAALAFIAVRQRDAVGLAIARDGLACFHPARLTPTHLGRLNDALANLRPRGKAQLAGALAGLGSRLSSPHMLVVLSDLLAERDALATPLSRLAAQGHDMMLWQVLHREEIDPPALRHTVVVDSEANDVLPIATADWRSTYARRFGHWIDSWRQTAARLGIEHHMLASHEPVHTAVRRCLAERMRRRRW